MLCYSQRVFRQGSLMTCPLGGGLRQLDIGTQDVRYWHRNICGQRGPTEGSDGNVGIPGNLEASHGSMDVALGIQGQDC